MKTKIALFLGRLFLGFGAALTVLAVIVTWSGSSNFRYLCNLPISDSFGISPYIHSIASKSEWSNNGRLNIFKGVAIEDPNPGMRGFPALSRHAADFHVVTFPKEPPLNLGVVIRRNLPDQKWRMNALVGTAAAFSLLLYGLHLLVFARGGLSGTQIVVFSGAIPLLGMAASFVSFYAAIGYPWDFFSGYYFALDTPESFLSEYRQAAFLSIALGVLVSTVTWAMQSFSNNEKS